MNYINVQFNTNDHDQLMQVFDMFNDTSVPAMIKLHNPNAQVSVEKGGTAVRLNIDLDIGSVSKLFYNLIARVQDYMNGGAISNDVIAEYGTESAKVGGITLDHGTQLMSLFASVLFT